MYTYNMYLVNLLPTSPLGDVSPVEKLPRKKASVKHLRGFGCLCFSRIPNNLDKFNSRYVVVVHMGYSPTQKVDKLFNLNT